MKHLSTFLLFVLLVNKSFAQDSTFVELGINATPFVNQYLDFGSGDGEFSSPYMITYERKFGKLGSRVGLGVIANNSNDKPINGKPTEPEFHRSAMQLDARLGAVLYKSLSNRWNLKYGMDAVVTVNNNKNWTVVRNVFGELVINTNSINEWQGGLAPFLFVQFHITKHFSIATELIGRATYGEIVTKVHSSEFPEFATRQESTTMNFNIAAPTALYLIFRF